MWGGAVFLPHILHSHHFFSFFTFCFTSSSSSPSVLFPSSTSFLPVLFLLLPPRLISSPSLLLLLLSPPPLSSSSRLLPLSVWLVFSMAASFFTLNHLCFLCSDCGEEIRGGCRSLRGVFSPCLFGWETLVTSSLPVSRPLIASLRLSPPHSSSSCSTLFIFSGSSSSCSTLFISSSFLFLLFNSLHLLRFLFLQVPLPPGSCSSAVSRVLLSSSSEDLFWALSRLLSFPTQFFFK